MSKLDMHDQRRVKAMHRLFGAGVILAVGATLIIAFLGASGGGGAAVFFLLVAFSAVVTAFSGFGFAMFDEVRRKPVALRRAGIASAYFGVALLAMFATVGAANTIGN